MRRKSRTPQAPLFTLTRPLKSSWKWQATYSIASSGYVTSMHVTASTYWNHQDVVGTAYCDVALGDDVSEVLEYLATEAMLAATEPDLTGKTRPRKVTFVGSAL